MSRHYRAVARIFGTNDAVHHVRRAMVLAEAHNPGYAFSITPLELYTADFATYGVELRGAANRDVPGFATVDLAEVTAIAPTVIVERVVDDSDIETVEVYQAGKLAYRTHRQEATGDIYEIGQAGVDYVYGSEEGIRDMFLLALTAAGIKHQLHPL